MKTFNQIYIEFHKIVLAYVAMKINDYSLAEELANDVFMKVHKHLANFDENKSSMKTWIINITKNTVIDHYRKNKLKMSSLDAPLSNDNNTKTIADLMPTSSNPHKEFITNEMMATIEAEINTLSPKYRDIAELYFNEDLSYNEICERLNLPLGTVKGQLSRAKNKLTKKLETLR